MKNHCGDNSKASKGSASTPISAFIRNSELSNKAKKDKKQKYYQGKKDSRKPKDFIILALGVNTAEVEGKRRRRNKKDVSKIMCFNCNKKGHYSNKYPKLPKN